MVAVAEGELVAGAIRPQSRRAEFAAVHFCDRPAVNSHTDIISLASQLQLIPFTDRFHGIFAWFHQVINRPRVVIACGCCVVDGNLQTIKANIFSRLWLEGVGAKEDPAVAARADFEVQPEYKVLPLFFMNHHVGTTLVGVDAALFNGPLALLLIACDPAIESFPVKQE